MISRIRKSCDVLVVGAGPAGIAASVSASESGATVILVDDNSSPGGQIWRADIEPSQSHGKEAELWFARLLASGAVFLPSTSVIAALDRNTVLAEQAGGAIEISFQAAVLATGARELLLPFPGWTLPNVFAAGGLQALVKSGFSVRGQRIAVAGSGPLLLAVAAFLHHQGAILAGIFEQSSLRHLVRLGLAMLARPDILYDALKYRATVRSAPYLLGWWPVAAEGVDKVRAISVANGITIKTIPCDMVACSFNLIPNTELPSIFGCTIASGNVEVDEWQKTSVENIFSAGESTGIAGVDAALTEGRIAGFCAAGNPTRAAGLFPQRRRLQRWARALDRAFALRPELRHLPQPDTIVCRCEDVPWSALRDEKIARQAKLYTRCGMGPCQGRVCGAALRYLSNWSGDLVRPPVFPVRTSTLIGKCEQQN